MPLLLRSGAMACNVCRHLWPDLKPPQPPVLPAYCRRLVGTLSSGQYFGEYSCMLGEPRIATVVATSYCELYSLSRADLESVVAEWPELAEELSLLGEWRLWCEGLCDGHWRSGDWGVRLSQVVKVACARGLRS